MPVTTTYPGIYIQETPSNSHTITASPTNIAVFIGYTHPLKTLSTNTGTPVQIFSFADYQKNFGGFVRSSAFARAWGIAGNPALGVPTNPGAFGDMAQAVNQFFLNAGAVSNITAYIVSVNNTNTNNGGVIPGLPPASLWLDGGTLSPQLQSPPPAAGITFTATEVTDELYAMVLTIRPVNQASFSPPSSAPADPLADITITYGPASNTAYSPPVSPPASPVTTGPGTVIERYRRVSLSQYRSDGKTPNPNYIGTAMSASALVSVSVGSPPGTWPATAASSVFPIYMPESTIIYNIPDFTAVLQEDTGLDKLQVFNLMILPGIADNSLTWSNDTSGSAIIGAAVAFCERKMAFLILDPPVADTADGNVAAAPGTLAPGMTQPNLIQYSVNAGLFPDSGNAALYFPYLLTPDPFTGSATNPVTNLRNEIPPSGTVAGLFAATDNARGVWKAPAGFQTVANASINGVVQRGQMTDPRQGTLNPLGVNCLRDFPNINTVVFGARTLATLTDQQWEYVPVRRMALFLEQTFYANLKWVVFEPNFQPLWSAITKSITSFMLGLFKQGAFQGDTPSDAFLVQCDGQTTTQDDINNGVVNIIVGFAPLKPAEFVVITITQLAGQTQTS
jgi:hypothetical protein